MVGEGKGTWGQRMIKFSVQFWTNDLPKGSDERTAWASGAIHIISMKHRGIKHEHIFFRNLDEFMPKFQELMDRNGIKLIQSEKTRQVKMHG